MNMADLFTSGIGRLRGRLLVGETMARHVSWRAGGVADRAYIPADLEDLAAFMRQLAPGEPVCFAGLGSNLLVRDGGYRGTVVLMHSSHASMGRRGEWVEASAGGACPKLARFAAVHDLEGAEFLAGIPGTVGGALAMNAGCHGSETWEFVREATTIDRAGALHRRVPADFEIAYRHVVLRGNAVLGVDEWFVGACFMFEPGDGVRARDRIRELLARRIATQPLGLPNAGSVFRNPEGDHAARLIEASGLKGTSIGGARISDKHANFIVNPGGVATASDIEALIEHAMHEVSRKFGIDLVPEVRIIGEAAHGAKTGGIPTRKGRT
jgi:UDP-N-acetylmuramate dehydrogenase